MPIFSIFYLKTFVYPKIVLTLQSQTASQKPRSGVKAGGTVSMPLLSASNELYFWKRLSALILGHWEFSQNSYLWQGLSNGRCPWICNFVLVSFVGTHGSCIRYWRGITMITYTGVGFCVACLNIMLLHWYSVSTNRYGESENQIRTNKNNKIRKEVVWPLFCYSDNKGFVTGNQYGLFFYRVEDAF